MNESRELKNELMVLTGIQWPEGLEETQWMEQLADHIDALINTDFHQLVQLLYRLDIDEAGYVARRMGIILDVQQARERRARHKRKDDRHGHGLRS